MNAKSSATRTNRRKARPKPKARRGRGRPTRYTADTASTICTRLAEGESLRSICRDNAMPAISTVMGWLFDGEHEDFMDQYARAREAQAEARADEIVDIADAGSGDITEDKDGKPVVDHEHIQRSRLRVDARNRYAREVVKDVEARKRESEGTP